MQSIPSDPTNPMIGQPGRVPSSRDQQIANASITGSVFATNALGFWSLIIGFVGFLLDFLMGAGILAALFGGGIAYLAYAKSKKLNGVGRGLAIAGLIANGAVLIFGLVMLVAIGALLGS